MKKKLATIGLPVLLSAAAIIGLATSKPIQGMPGSRADSPSVYSFDYYPKANVYYDHGDNTYSFMDKDGNWKTSRELPASQQVNLDKKITLNGTSKNIWKENEQHRLIYSIQLYSSPKDFKADPPPPPPQVTIKEEDPEKPGLQKTEPKQKGLKKFFNKLFGKDKKEV